MKYFFRIFLAIIFTSFSAFAAEEVVVTHKTNYKLKALEFYKKISHWDDSYKPKWFEKYVNNLEKKFKEEDNLIATKDVKPSKELVANNSIDNKKLSLPNSLNTSGVTGSNAADVAPKAPTLPDDLSLVKKDAPKDLATANTSGVTGSNESTNNQLSLGGEIKTAALIPITSEKNDSTTKPNKDSILEDAVKEVDKLEVNTSKDINRIEKKDLKPDLEKYDPKYQEQLKLAAEKKKQDQEDLDKFIQDELVMLVMPQDDVYLGKESNKVKFSYAEDSVFFKKFWDGLDSSKVSKNAIKIKKYVSQIKRKPVMLTSDEAILGSEESIARSDIGSLRTVINHTEDDIVSNGLNGLDLLSNAVESDKYNIVYYLLMRGANPNKIDKNGEKLINKASSSSIAWLLDRSTKF